MVGFKDIERAYEAKFASDEAQQFRAFAKRDQLMAEWAAGLLGRTDLAAYAGEVIRADLEEPGDEDVVRKLVKDLEGKADEATIRARLTEMLVEAKRQLLID